MGTIIAIGGGRMGWIEKTPDGKEYQTPVETTHIDSSVVRLTQKVHPKVLYVGTASHDNTLYMETVRKQYVEQLGCSSLEPLNLETEDLSYNDILKKVMDTDIIYVGGGDTTHMLKIWRKKRFDEILHQAYQKGVVLSGVSAGAICWFDWYDNMDDVQTIDELDFVKGLSLIKGFCVPHYEELTKEEKQKINFLLTEKGISGWALDNCSAIIFQNDKVEIISNEDGRTARKIP